MSASTLVLVDSSAWVFALRRDGIEHIRRRVDKLLDEDRVATCRPIVCELLGGTKSPKEFDRLERDLEGLVQLDLDDSVWKRAARVAFAMVRAGKQIPTLDCIIAGAAIQHAVMLAHCDDHFDQIAKTTPLKVESYVHLVRRARGHR